MRVMKRKEISEWNRNSRRHLSGSSLYQINLETNRGKFLPNHTVLPLDITYLCVRDLIYPHCRILVCYWFILLEVQPDNKDFSGERRQERLEMKMRSKPI